ncbi:cryptochrome/photolyase family protein [Rhodopirellula sp. MGV]|uniref:cryptochrome/photolyase family protein n=1 Tax=Rhodopirellula sp. MGV TaxID=2023130 RepID=UPI000B96BA6C|nr:cryptochrome/photolyase family protein [Rhodopirellula sp. MGV]OYP31667.1 cryptochrome/photolyase family protein [Rhodopirellula sp. MGV]PNY33972.1 cryptochrome/photolyase family protein [Rhodopirellula baltica]
MIALVFPHQLYAPHPIFEHPVDRVVLIEDSLFFDDPRYPAKFHKQKLWLHRASMRQFEAILTKEGRSVRYLEFDPKKPLLSDRVEEITAGVAKSKQSLLVVDPVDFVLERRIRKLADQLGVELTILPTPGFLNSDAENREYRDGKKRWFMADFYKWQRTRLNVLLDGDGEPAGGQWSFDEDNRKKIPKTRLKSLPELPKIARNSIEKQVRDSVVEQFEGHPGSLDALYYPTTHPDALQWFDVFLKERFKDFGPYEDAIEEGQSWLWHSVLTPVLNIGLLTPQQVLDKTLEFAQDNDLPINSVEGFVRQIIGWREFMRATYVDLGVKMRTTNHWQHHRPLPKCFYDGTTGIVPIDDTIKRLLDTGYCHHIERLMVLGGFLFLCEIDPDEIYRWFMELFIDSYDWVMVPNVYAMSQNADGGLITTKPYFSGSSYVRKMSHYSKGRWCDVWDGLYWRWIWNHREELGKNPRWAMMCSMAEKMDKAKMDAHLKNAENYLGELA